MQPKPLRVSVPVTAKTLEAAVTELQGRFLRLSKTGVRVVRQPTEFNLAGLCRGLIDDWQSGKVDYSTGEITLSFSQNGLSQNADLVIYKPEQGDRFLYAKRPDPVPHPHPVDLQGLTANSQAADGHLTDYLLQTLHRALEAIAELTANQRAIESRLDQVLNHTAQLEQQLQAAIGQTVANQINATALHFHERLDAIAQQIHHLSDSLNDEENTQPSPDSAESTTPQTRTEWSQRIKATWGTVGDYEQYSNTYRAANAATPLDYTPDWIALCELEWARQLSPTLAQLYALIYDSDGIGYEAANILHQFGCHIDAQTGDRYYIYQRSGFTAYDALWQIVRNPQHSWLPELRQIAERVGHRYPDIFKLFGWEVEAIASLDSVIERAYREQQSTDESRTHHQPHPESTLHDDLAILNLGPFTPLTLDIVKRAYRQAMKAAHPDTGGSKEQAQRVNEAYEAVMQHYFPHATGY